MFGDKLAVDLIDRSAENEADRRKFLRAAGLAGVGVVGAGMAAGLGAGSASADDRGDGGGGGNGGPSDGAILNFALNLEYLEAEFYSQAVFGKSLPNSLTGGKGREGGVIGGKKVDFKSKYVRQYAREIAIDELNHVKFLRSALGSAKVARPRINLVNSFTAAATAAGLIKPGQKFNPFKDEDSFLLGAFIFEDVGVTAYKGAAPLINSATYLSAAAGILAVEAYHAGVVRTSLERKGLSKAANAISDARDSLDGRGNKDQGLGKKFSNLVPTNGNSIVFGRTPGQVLNIVYLTPKKAKKGGFFPNGVNGSVNTSS